MIYCYRSTAAAVNTACRALVYLRAHPNSVSCSCGLCVFAITVHSLRIFLFPAMAVALCSVAGICRSQGHPSQSVFVCTSVPHLQGNVHRSPNIGCHSSFPWQQCVGSSLKRCKHFLLWQQPVLLHYATLCFIAKCCASFFM